MAQKASEVRDGAGYLRVSGAHVAACSFVLETQDQRGGSHCRDIVASQAQGAFSLHLARHCTWYEEPC